MPDPATTNLVLAVPTRGSDSGTWDTPVNGDMIILDACAGSVTTKSLTNANITLSTTESQVSILRFTGTMTGNVTVLLGAVIKSWIVENLTVNPSFVLAIVGSTGTGRVIMPPPGSSQIYWDGTNVSFINMMPPIGCFVDFGTSTVPSWITSCSVPPFLACDGSTYSSVTYPLLFPIITTNTLPDTRGRARFALDGGTGRITTGGGGIDGTNRFIGGGSQNVILTQSNFPNLTFPTTLAISDTRTWRVSTGGQQVIIGGGGADFGGGGQGAGVTGDVTVIGGSIGLTGGTQTGGSGANVFTMPPTYIGGITMIRAA